MSAYQRTRTSTLSAVVALSLFCAMSPTWGQEEYLFEGLPDEEQVREQSAPFDPHTSEFSPRERRAPWEVEQPRQGLEPFESASGFFFAAGKYVPPPYRLRFESNTLYINDTVVLKVEEPTGRRFRRPRFEGYYDTPLSRMAGQLETGALVIALADQPLVVLDRTEDVVSLLQLLLHEAPATVDAANFDLPEGMSPSAWTAWINSFNPDADFSGRARQVIDEAQRLADESRGQINAVRRLDALAYPLTVLGMILATLATGHLLLSAPLVSRSSYDTDVSPERLQMVFRSLALVGVLSILDLVWTVLASQAGHMRELNPLGSHLIHDPVQLVYFKFGSTGMGVAVLFTFRRFQRIQLAAWWACLICTLVTFRWLTFNSMFVS